ncbi:cbb3-type cytochrome oxidase assembly protein CcoS [Pseudotabrizicola sediminis]|uniref:Cbb3-type cytochrome oxidase assembly protein CcoS n=2 Tax=Pseudotabrizicola TaxID=2939641 RepID=A0ABY2KPX5_9RHOB|nr:cbb3-type cytochrome oxidase assembly protein CcoS [Pseudotabrizicola sediminis]TGD44763.1 cbb3-type cytochrome oxidase assembly protein CcoS [Pseudotabrizicola sediminis]TGD67664.1 cbb3-type cytochrome oxidase assembly protein CcoS [Tabrizicola sp. WMC-M-20]
MEILGLLIPVSLILGGLGLAAFFWAMRTKQFDDPEGDANRILTKDYDDKPKPEEPKP